jgi:hypothetical protein
MEAFVSPKSVVHVSPTYAATAKKGVTYNPINNDSSDEDVDQEAGLHKPLMDTSDEAAVDADNQLAQHDKDSTAYTSMVRFLSVAALVQPAGNATELSAKVLYGKNSSNFVSNLAIYGALGWQLPIAWMVLLAGMLFNYEINNLTLPNTLKKLPDVIIPFQLLYQRIYLRRTWKQILDYSPVLPEEFALTDVKTLIRNRNQPLITSAATAFTIAHCVAMYALSDRVFKTIIENQPWYIQAPVGILEAVSVLVPATSRFYGADNILTKWYLESDAWRCKAYDTAHEKLPSFADWLALSEPTDGMRANQTLSLFKKDLNRYWYALEQDDRDTLINTLDIRGSKTAENNAASMSDFIESFYTLCKTKAIMSKNTDCSSLLYTALDTLIYISTWLSILLFTEIMKRGLQASRLHNPYVLEPLSVIFALSSFLLYLDMQADKFMQAMYDFSRTTSPLFFAFFCIGALFSASNFTDTGYEMAQEGLYGFPFIAGICLLAFPGFTGSGTLNAVAGKEQINKKRPDAIAQTVAIDYINAGILMRMQQKGNNALDDGSVVAMITTCNATRFQPDGRAAVVRTAGDIAVNNTAVGGAV